MPVEVTCVKETLGKSLLDGTGGKILPESFWRLAGQAIADEIRANVVAQVKYDGSRQKQNAQMTLERKRKLGRPLRSLMDDPAQWRFARLANYVIDVGREQVTVGPRDKDVAVGVQQKGYTDWMRPNRERLDKRLRKFIAEAIRRAASVAKRHRKTERIGPR